MVEKFELEMMTRIEGFYIELVFEGFVCLGTFLTKSGTWHNLFMPLGYLKLALQSIKVSFLSLFLLKALSQPALTESAVGGSTGLGFQSFKLSWTSRHCSIPLAPSHP